MIAFHLTSPESTVIGACVTAAGYMVLTRRQKATGSITVEAKDIVERIEGRIDDLSRIVQAHTADGDAHYRRQRRLGLGGLLGVLVKLFF